MFPFTPVITLSISRLKSRVMKLSFLSLKMMVKSGLEFILKLTEPLQIPAKLPGQFSHCGQIFLHWAAATLKGLGEFPNKKSRPILPSFLRKNGNFKTRDFSPLIKRVLAGVLSMYWVSVMWVVEFLTWGYKIGLILSSKTYCGSYKN